MKYHECVFFCCQFFYSCNNEQNFQVIPISSHVANGRKTSHLMYKMEIR